MEDDRYAGVSNSVEHRNEKGNVHFTYSISPEMMEKAKQRAREIDRENGFNDNEVDGQFLLR